MLKMKTNKQKKKLINKNAEGFSAIGMVITLLLMSSFLLLEMNQISVDVKRNAYFKRKQFKSVNLTLSALVWAKSQQWDFPNENWQCKSDIYHQFKACIKLINLASSSLILLKSEYEKTKRYHFVSLKAGKIIFNKRNWLDYCPVFNRKFCYE